MIKEVVLFSKERAWGNSLDLNAARINFKPSDINSLKALLSKYTIDEIGKLNTPINRSQYPELERTIKEIRENFLNSSPGFVILTGLAESDIPTEKWGDVYRIITDFVGDIVPQDDNILEMKEVRDRGGNVDESRRRYSDGKQGGGLHTDGVERPMEMTPEYFGFVCIRTAKTGGKSQLISAYTLHNHLSQENPEALDILYQPFHFDLRGDNIGGKKTTQKPVFFQTSQGIGITYLRKYIDAGHEHAETPDLTTEQRAALDYLDNLLTNPEIIAEGYLKTGDVILVNNKTTIHGRTSFEDYEEPEKKRSLFRTWIKERD